MKMIESSVLGSSPWNCDQFLSKDLLPFPSMDNNNILDTDGTELENDWLEKLTLSSCSTSSVHSVSTASSEDWVSHDLTSDGLSNVYSLSSSEILFPRVFDEESIIDPLGLNTFDLTPAFPDSLTDYTASNDSSSDNIPSLPNSPKHKKKRQSPDPFSASKSWSRMTCEEQLETVEALTQIISHQMGLREQLEIIRIIDPSAVVSPADTEFVIDLAFLNDAKLQLIRDFIRRCAFVLPCRGLGSHGTSTKHSLSSNSGGNTNNRSNHSSSYPRKLSKKQSREKRPQLKGLNMRQRKEYRQLLKERRSGLFIREEVLSLSTCHLKEEDEEDINILE